MQKLLSLQQAVNPTGETFGTTAAENLEKTCVLGVSRQVPISGVKERKKMRMKALEKQAQTQESL